MPKVVTAFEQVDRNIREYVSSLEQDSRLAQRLPYHRAWYAIQQADGEWLFGPSKFIGYQDASARDYLASYSRKDGGETEAGLQPWFESVDLTTALGRDLHAQFETFASRYGKTANARWRVSVPRDSLPGRKRRAAEIGARIAFDPAILGGRPHIRGTRVGVSHILAALAAGDTADEIVEELPWLSHADIQAALEYAAQSVDHPVMIAA